MALPSRVIDARRMFKNHLDRANWSDLTAGRKKILEVFLKLASVEGYSAVTMRTLAKNANVKAASIYFHFPGGRSEIVCESLRWHYTNWGYSVLAAIEGCDDVQLFWDRLVFAVLEHQITVPASDLWDLLVRMDRVGGFLEPEFRREIEHWLDLCANLFISAANEMGYNVGRETIRIIMSILDASTTWCEAGGDNEKVRACGVKAIALTRSILASQS